MELDKLRVELNEINKEMLELLKRRLDISVNIAKAKSEKGLPILDKGREREIINWVIDNSNGYETYTRLFFSTLFDLSKTLQNNILTGDSELYKEIKSAILPSDNVFPKSGKLACQGVEGAYSQQAADRLFPIGQISFYSTFRDVFEAVNKGECDYGILPIENSIHGSVNEVYDLLNEYSFYIIRSYKHLITHELLVKKDTDFEDIKEIFSHSQALGQCSNFLNSLEGIKVTSCKNTALASKMVAESDDNSLAAISSHSCAQLYDLKSLNTSIANNDNNYTRFIVISKDMLVYPGSNKITLVLSAPHRPGGLYSVMAQFAALGLNLTKLESHPIPGKDFNFLFYFDIEGSVVEENTLKLLESLQYQCDNFHFLGNYSEL